MLSSKGDISRLYNYSGKRFNIRDIIGNFSKDNNTKEIILNTSKLDKT
jgi:hypothetical protein